MKNIRHLITINATPSKVYHAISEQEGLSSWWTQDTKVNLADPGILEFGFGNGYTKKMKIIHTHPTVRLEWKCVDAHPEWIGTKIVFDLTTTKEHGTLLRFSHEGWRDETDMYAICNFNWAKFMMSLKSFCETGKGDPHIMEVVTVEED
jgi:uncharacterized protein YndB with AHSA1/START domain